MPILTRAAAIAVATLAFAGAGAAQDVLGTGQAGEEADAAAEQDKLVILFESGSARIGHDQTATLDQAARLFREGSPIVMIVAGGADTTGSPDANLDLSVQRAQAVIDGLVARDIPAARLQLLGRGTTELAVDTPEGVASPENRRVEITWR